MFSGVLMGGARFDDLSGVSQFMRSDGTLDIRLLAAALSEEVGPQVSFKEISEWSAASGLQGMLVEFEVTLDIDLQNESGALDVHVFVVVIQRDDEMAVLAAAARVDEAETYRPLIEAVFATAR
jgi:hypothetical protein